ncbi:hypothetical protein MPSEU_000764500 [Mayamaea pseudoterrestris]|nr:hypothetical protein MPSEU_000764500 [Mayamaea pseudoterrestris]
MGILIVIILAACLLPAAAFVASLANTRTKHHHASLLNIETYNNINDRRLLQDCVCLVTGASRGIGKGIAVELGSHGAIVYVTGTSSRNATTCNTTTRNTSSSFDIYVSTNETGGPGTIDETADQVTAAGGFGVAVYCNHADDAQVKALMQRIQIEYGRLDILVNNAFRLPSGGVSVLQSKFYQDGAIQAWDTLHTVGLRSHFVATSLAMPLLLKASRRRRHKHLARPLVAMVSSFGGLSYTFNVPYGVGKAAVDRMAKDMAVELGMDETNVCVVSFWPGVVNTERTQQSVISGEWDQLVGIPLENAESPRLTGRAIIAVATDANNMAKAGTVQVVAELAREYKFVDINGKEPVSIRSLQFLLPAYAFDDKMRQRVPTWLIPDWKLPFWLMASGRPPAPNE